MPTDEDLLEELRGLLAARGKLTSSLIEASEITRPPNTYIRRFGGLIAAYARIGYDVSERQRATSDRFGKLGRRGEPSKSRVALRQLVALTPRGYVTPGRITGVPKAPC
jgi:hypothetical protein